MYVRDYKYLLFINRGHCKQKLYLFLSAEKKEMSNYPLNVDSEAEIYEVEQILDKQPYGDQYMYLIKWKDFPDPKDYTWQPVSHLTNVRQLLGKFNAKYDKKVKGKSFKIGNAAKKRTNHLNNQRNIDIYDRVSSSELDEEVQKAQTKRISQKQKKIKKLKQLDPCKKSSEKNIQKGPKVESMANIFKKSFPKQPEVNKIKPKPIEQGKFWQRQGRSLGRIHKHYYENGEIIFNVNVNNREELVCATAYLTLDQLAIDYEEKLIEYMQNWSKCQLVEGVQRKEQAYKTFERYWKEVR